MPEISYSLSSSSDDEKDESGMSYIMITLICLAIFYSVLLFASALQFFRLFSTLIKRKSALAFYIVLMVAVLSRAIIFLTFILKTLNKDSDQTITYFLIVLPDLIYCCVYLMNVWTYCGNFILAHVSLAKDVNFFEDKQDRSLESQTNIIMYIILSVYTTLFITLSMITVFSAMSKTVLPLVNSVFDLLFPLIAIIYYVYLLFKYSGSPYVNEHARLQSRKMLITVGIWTLSRIVSGILCLTKSSFYIESATIELYDISKSTLLTSIILIAYCTVTEFLPTIISLNSEIINQYIESSMDHKEELIKSKTVEGIIIDNEETRSRRFDINRVTFDSNDPISSNQINENSIVIMQDFVVKYRDFSIVSTLAQKTKHSLGPLLLGLIGGNEIVVRLIEFTRLSRYNLENFSQDIDEIM